MSNDLKLSIVQSVASDICHEWFPKGEGCACEDCKKKASEIVNKVITQAVIRELEEILKVQNAFYVKTYDATIKDRIDQLKREVGE